MANTIILKRSATPGKVPTTAQLALGEIGINTYDGLIYIKKDDGTASVVQIGGVTSVNGETGAVTIDTGDVSENGNLYFTTARARASLSGTGAISYNSSTGAFTTTQNLTTAGSPAFAGLTLTGGISSIAGSIIPSADITYDLGSPTKQWKDIYVGPGSLYVNGSKVLEDVNDTITFSADLDQNIRIKTTGTGILQLGTSTTNVNVDGTLQMASGKRITDSAGVSVQFGNAIQMNSAKIIGLGTPTANTDAATKAYVDSTVGALSTTSITQGNSSVQVVDSGTGTVTVTVDGSTALTVTSTGVVVAGNFTVSGTTTTVDSNTVSVADNILTLNSDTTGVPTQNAGIEVERGDEANTQLRWNEGSDTWTFTNDGAVYYPMATGTDTLAEGSTNLYFTTARARNSISASSATGVSYNSTTGAISLGSIPNTSLSNSSITINGTAVALGGTRTLDTDSLAEGTNQYFTTARARSSLVAGTGIAYNSTSGSISTSAIPNASLTNSSVTVGSTAISLGASSTTLAGLTSVTSTGFTGALTGNADTATSAGKWTTARTLALTGDATASGSFDGSANYSQALTLATVNSNVGQFGSATAIPVVTVNAKGLITAISTTAVSIPSGALTFTGDVTGTGTTGSSTALTIKTSPTLTTPTLSGTTTVSGNLVPSADLTYDLGSSTNRFRNLYLSGSTIAIAGSTSGTLTLASPAVAGITTVTFPATTGTVITTGDTGTVTNTMLAGSIANAKLSNSSVTVGTTAIALGASSTTLAGLTSVTSTGFTGALTGNASTASAWATARTITLAGDLSGSVSIDGSSNVILTATVSADATTLGTDTTGNYVASITNGSYLTGANGGSEGAALTLAVDATSLNTASKVVARDASGNFSAGTITATLTGNVTGNVTGTSGSTTGNAATVTNGVYTTDTGTVTNTMLAGSIANAKLLNSSTTIGTTAIALGASSTTLAGLTSVTSTAFVGALTGNASTATTAGTVTTAAQTAITSVGTLTGLTVSGATATGALSVTGAITATGEVTAYFSDLRLKTNIVPIEDALAKVEAINGVTFDPNETALALGIEDRHQMGVIAQEIEAVAPELVCDSAFAGYKTVRYDKLTALLIEAVKELSAKVKTLEAQLGGTKPQL